MIFVSPKSTIIFEADIFDCIYRLNSELTVIVRIIFIIPKSGNVLTKYKKKT